ncbi:MAG: hydroxymethylbilane synthase [Planctomycetes bacterium]|nr:hydroxymethylbilane synthase [Planctomycetota bacterium]
MSNHLRIATRSSPLAMWQAHFIKKQLLESHRRLQIEILPIKSSGDKDLETPLYGMGNIGVFAKEVHEFILDGRADIGVHSCKDLPTQSPDGVHISAFCKRHDPRDSLISSVPLDALPNNACIGTSSLRRQTQLKALRSDLEFKNIRGNVGTRLSKIDSGEYAATLMAYAGLCRLGIQHSSNARPFDPWHELCPAPGQGAIAIDCLIDNHKANVVSNSLDHLYTRMAVSAERELLSMLRGGCSLPLGCYVKRQQGRWHMHAVLADENHALKRAYVQGPCQSLAAQAIKLIT